MVLKHIHKYFDAPLTKDGLYFHSLWKWGKLNDSLLINTETKQSCRIPEKTFGKMTQLYPGSTSLLGCTPVEPSHQVAQKSGSHMDRPCVGVLAQSPLMAYGHYHQPPDMWVTEALDDSSLQPSSGPSWCQMKQKQALLIKPCSSCRFETKHTLLLS